MYLFILCLCLCQVRTRCGKHKHKCKFSILFRGGMEPKIRQLSILRMPSCLCSYRGRPLCLRFSLCRIILVNHLTSNIWIFAFSVYNVFVGQNGNVATSWFTGCSQIWRHHQFIPAAASSSTNRIAPSQERIKYVLYQRGLITAWRFLGKWEKNQFFGASRISPFCTSWDDPVFRQFSKCCDEKT